MSRKLLLLVLQWWLYYREHLKYVLNVYCVTNRRRDLHTTETTATNSFLSWNKLFPFCFNIRTFNKWTIAFPSYLFTVRAKIAMNTGLSDFEINFKADARGRRTRRFAMRIFKRFVTIEFGSYAWSQVSILQGKPLEFSDFHRFTAIAASVNTFLLGEEDQIFWWLMYARGKIGTAKYLRHGQALSTF